MGNRLSKGAEELSKCWIFGGLAFRGAFLSGVLAVLMVRSVDIAVPIVVLLTVPCAGVPFMRLNGKCRLTLDSRLT